MINAKSMGQLCLAPKESALAKEEVSDRANSTLFN